jgi:dTDP-4-amino-4,6-dideoxygalactose transaminase
MSSVIPAANPQAQYVSHQAEIDAAIAAALGGNRYILGPQTQAFEQEFAAYLGVRYASGVGSGTEALHVAIRACGLGPGDEIITVAHTAVATVAAIELAGATPVLVDIDPVTYTIDPDRIEAAITPRTKAIIPVHLYGAAASLNPIVDLARRHNLRVIEDCAQAHGARYAARDRVVGSYGDVSCFSFYPTKNLGAIGDGGLVATNDPAIAENLNLLRQYGWRERYVSEIAGWNTRLDELQAAILRVKLRHLDEDNDKRRQLAASYDEQLAGVVTLPAEPVNTRHVYHLYVIRHPQRDALMQFLRERGIGTAIHYPVPIHLQPAYRGRLGDASSLPETERAAREIVSLPMYPELSEKDVGTVAQAIREFAAQ